MQDRKQSTIGDFRVESFGEGDMRTLCIGGMSYAPSDFEPLAHSLGGTVLVADNPYQAGRIPWSPAFVADLRRRYIKLIHEARCSMLIAHSCGSFDALHIQESMPSVDRMVLLTPPNGARQWMPESSRIDNFGFLDRCLADLCADMPEDLYRTMLEHHRAQYAPNDRAMKTLYKHEMPARRQESPEGIIELLRASRKDILLVFGKRDPWKIVDPGTVDYGRAATVQQIDTGHFPHISKPLELMAMIETWMAGHASVSTKVQPVSEGSAKHQSVIALSSDA